jgi:Meckelin (Transmembrane protein 67)
MEGFFSSLFPMPPKAAANKPILVHDFHNSFSRVLFCGIESNLVLFEMLMYSVIQACTQSTALAASITYAVTLVVRWLKKRFAENNIARKSLVDPHFLL